MPSTEQAVTAASSPTYTVIKDGMTTGRNFTSFVAADRYAKTIGGEVRAI